MFLEQSNWLDLLEDLSSILNDNETILTKPLADTVYIVVN